MVKTGRHEEEARVSKAYRTKTICSRSVTIVVSLQTDWRSKANYFRTYLVFRQTGRQKTITYLLTQCSRRLGVKSQLLSTYSVFRLGVKSQLLLYLLSVQADWASKDNYLHTYSVFRLGVKSQLLLYLLSVRADWVSKDNYLRTYSVFKQTGRQKTITSVFTQCSSRLGVKRQLLTYLLSVQADWVSKDNYLRTYSVLKSLTPGRSLPVYKRGNARPYAAVADVTFSAVCQLHISLRGGGWGRVQEGATVGAHTRTHTHTHTSARARASPSKRIPTCALLCRVF